MNTLDQILESGTAIEKQLAQLAQQYPTHPEEIVSQAISQERKSYLKWLAGGIIGMPILGLDNMVGIALIGLTSFIASQHLIKASEYKSAKKNISNLIEWQKQNFTGNNTFFYYTNNHFTYSPTPVDTLFGKRIYPINSFEDINSISPQNSLVFLSDVIVKEKTREFDTYQDFVPGAGGCSIDYTRLTLSIEKEGRSIEYTTSVRSSLLEDTSNFFQLDTGKKISLVCQMKDDNHLAKIIESYHYFEIKNNSFSLNLEDKDSKPLIKELSSKLLLKSNIILYEFI